MPISVVHFSSDGNKVVWLAVIMKIQRELLPASFQGSIGAYNL